MSFNCDACLLRNGHALGSLDEQQQHRIHARAILDHELGLSSIPFANAVVKSCVLPVVHCIQFASCAHPFQQLVATALQHTALRVGKACQTFCLATQGNRASLSVHGRVLIIRSQLSHAFLDRPNSLHGAYTAAPLYRLERTKTITWDVQIDKRGCFKNAHEAQHSAAVSCHWHLDQARQGTVCKRMQYSVHSA
jgi:hypothetical protein